MPPDPGWSPYRNYGPRLVVLVDAVSVLIAVGMNGFYHHAIG